jgi:hypothetical protein
MDINELLRSFLGRFVIRAFEIDRTHNAAVWCQYISSIIGHCRYGAFNFGDCNPGELAHSSRRAAASAWRIFCNAASLSGPEEAIALFYVHPPRRRSAVLGRMPTYRSRSPVTPFRRWKPYADRLVGKVGKCGGEIPAGSSLSVRNYPTFKTATMNFEAGHSGSKREFGSLMLGPSMLLVAATSC